MKVFYLGMVLLLSHTFVIAQYSEFKLYDNGYVYPDTTMQQLARIVETQQLRFKSCELNPVYYSVPMAVTHKVTVHGKDARLFKKALRMGISYENVLLNFSQAKVIEGVRLLRFSDINEAGDSVKTYRELPLPGSQYNELHDVAFGPDNAREKVGSWIYTYSEGGEYTKAEARAYFIKETFSQHPLTAVASRYIQYADCLIDTQTSLYLPTAKNDYRWREGNSNNAAIDTFLSWIFYLTSKPEYGGEDDKTYYKRDSMWEAEHIAKTGIALKNYDWLQEKFDKAIAQAIQNGGSNDYFEDYVAAHHSPKVALELKRSRRVYGMCSMDNSPRRHAIALAQLAAQSVSWEVFLRAHLDVMNDNFPRLSDGSYAWGQRGTYFAELEALQIDAPNLLLGTAFRFDPAATNHYFGSIGRLGRALAEASYCDTVATHIIELVADSTLDDYNRLIMYYLFTHFNHYLGDEAEKSANEAQMAQAIAKLPDYIQLGLSRKKR